jgi:glycine/D-amino acid oxidase-like deaminating enzyme
VVVVGAGITGLTAAYLIAKAGKRVIVLERGRCAATDTGHTSAHLTMVTDERLSDLANGFGRTDAQAVWDAGLAAIAQIDDIVREHDIDAGFEWVDGRWASAAWRVPPSFKRSWLLDSRSVCGS